MSVTYFAAISKRVPAKFTVKKRGGKKQKKKQNLINLKMNMKKKSYIIQILYFSNFKITVTHELFLTKKKKIQNKSVS